MDKKSENQAATYVSVPERESIISDERLSFRVRNGAGRFPLSIATWTIGSKSSGELLDPTASGKVVIVKVNGVQLQGITAHTE